MVRQAATSRPRRNSSSIQAMFRTSVAALVLAGSACAADRLGDRIAGKDGCFFNAQTGKTYCFPGSAGEALYTQEQRQEKWVGRKQIDVELDPWFSVRRPEIKTLSDGTIMWTYSEAAKGRCQSSAPNKDSTCTTVVDPLTKLPRTNCVESPATAGVGRCEARDMNHRQFVIKNGVVAKSRFIPAQ